MTHYEYICACDSHYTQVLQSREGISLHALQLVITDDSAKDIRMSYITQTVYYLASSFVEFSGANIRLTGTTAW